MKNLLFLLCFLLLLATGFQASYSQTEDPHSTYHPTHTTDKGLEDTYHNPDAPVLNKDFDDFKAKIDDRISKIEKRLDDLEAQIGHKKDDGKHDSGSSFSDVWSAITDLQDQINKIKK
jgi:Skp family chaperone for outer membrane proteins